MNFKSKLLGVAIFCAVQSANAATITAFDQYMLELINQMRADPQAAANTYLGGNLNEGVPSNKQITSTAKQPLAWDASLVTAAQNHTTDMLNNNFFSHTGTGNTSPFQRMTAAGYTYQTAGENLAGRAQFGISGVTTQITSQLNTDLFIDSGVLDRGHRTNMLNPSFEAVGISIGYSAAFSPLSGFPSNVATIDFGANTQGPFLTGVAYTDSNADHFYTPGEGLGGLSVLAYVSGTSNLASSTTTLTAGGYSLALPSGTYDLEINGPLGRLSKQGVVMGSNNVKLDYNNITAVPVPAAMWLFVTAVCGLLVGNRRRYSM